MLLVFKAFTHVSSLNYDIENSWLWEYWIAAWGRPDRTAQCKSDRDGLRSLDFDQPWSKFQHLISLCIYKMLISTTIHWQKTKTQEFSGK